MDGSNNTHKWPDKPVGILGMPVAVTELRVKGRRMSKQEYAAAIPLLGRLYLVHHPGDKSMRRNSAMHLARSGVGELGDVRTPLFAPVLESLDGKGFVLAGYEIDSGAGQVFEYRQAWLVRPLVVE